MRIPLHPRWIVIGLIAILQAVFDPTWFSILFAIVVILAAISDVWYLMRK